MTSAIISDKNKSFFTSSLEIEIKCPGNSPARTEWGRDVSFSEDLICKFILNDE